MRSSENLIDRIHRCVKQRESTNQLDDRSFTTTVDCRSVPVIVRFSLRNNDLTITATTWWPIPANKVASVLGQITATSMLDRVGYSIDPTTHLGRCKLTAPISSGRSLCRHVQDLYDEAIIGVEKFCLHCTPTSVSNEPDKP